MREQITLHIASMIIVSSDASGWEYGMRAGMENYVKPELPMWFGAEIDREIERLNYWLRGSGPVRLESWIAFYSAYGQVLTSYGIDPSAVRNAAKRVVDSPLHIDLRDGHWIEPALSVYLTAYRALLKSL